MEDETVQVTIQVPKGISDFVKKLAALDGSSPEEWYQHWIQRSFNSITDNNFIIEELNVDRVKRLYSYDP